MKKIKKILLIFIIFPSTLYAQGLWGDNEAFQERLYREDMRLQGLYQQQQLEEQNRQMRMLRMEQEERHWQRLAEEEDRNYRFRKEQERREHDRLFDPYN